MKNFLKKVVLFSLIPIGLGILCLFIPPTPRAETSLLFGYLQKDSMLRHVEAPRIIFVGGSNLSFGLNSQLIKDQLELNPINTGVHAGVGLKFMLENTIEYVQAGDLVVLVPEYHHFLVSYANGSDELLRVVLDVYPNKVADLSIEQISNLLPYLPKFLKSKFELGEYRKVVEPEFYGRHSFNRYGDVFQHWDNEKLAFGPTDKGGGYHPEIMPHLIQFREDVRQKGAKMLVSYPCLQDESFGILAEEIKQIEQDYKQAGFDLIGTPENYILPDSLLFNTYYHPLKEGLDLRTEQFINDFENWKKNNDPKS